MPDSPQQYPLIDVEVEPLPEAAPPQQDIFLVAAFRRVVGSGYWKIHRDSQCDEHETREGAEEQARQLSDAWSHRCIGRMRLGGGSTIDPFEAQVAELREALAACLGKVSQECPFCNLTTRYSGRPAIHNHGPDCIAPIIEAVLAKTAPKEAR